MNRNEQYIIASIAIVVVGLSMWGFIATSNSDAKTMVLNKSCLVTCKPYEGWYDTYVTGCVCDTTRIVR